MTRSLLLFAAVVLVAGLVGCGGKTETHASSGSAGKTDAPAAALPEGLMLAKAPDNPVDIKDAKKSVKEGDEVVLRGRIGGMKKEYGEGYATLFLTDMSLPSCDLRPGDTCPTPWDYCCETKETLENHRVLLQITGPDGKPLKTNLEGAKGLEPLNVLVVKGKVVKVDAANFIVNASGIYVQEVKQKKG